MKKVPLPLKVHPDIKTALEKEAKNIDQPLSRHAESILSKHVSKQEVKPTAKKEVK